MGESFHATRRVEFRDTDAAGIAHFSAFFFYMESVEHELLRSVGLSVLAPDALGAVSWPRVSAQCDYKSAARFEDVLDVTVRIARLGGSSITYEFDFACQGRAVAAGRVVVVCCRFSAGSAPKAMLIPEEILSKLQPFAA